MAIFLTVTYVDQNKFEFSMPRQTISSCSLNVHRVVKIVNVLNKKITKKKKITNVIS